MLFVVFQIHKDAAVAIGIEELSLAFFKIGLIDLVAGLEGFFQDLLGQQVTVLELDQGVATPGGRAVLGHFEQDTGGAVELDHQAFFEIIRGYHRILPSELTAQFL